MKRHDTRKERNSNSTVSTSYGKIAPHRKREVITAIKLGDKANEVDELFGRLRELVNISAC